MKNLWYISGAIDFIVLDLVTKWLATMHLQEPVTVLDKVLTLHVSFNPNIAFSLPIPGRWVAVITPLILIGVFWYLKKSRAFEYKLTKIATMFLFAGGLGNFINRIWTGSVVDFIDFPFWPSFNLADVYITVGGFLILLFYGKIHRSNI